MWEVTEDALEAIATGAAILGSGGGGNPYIGRLRVRELLRSGASIRAVKPSELADDALVVVCGAMGSPVVNFEKLPSGDEEVAALRAVEDLVGRPVDAVAPFEMGGGNSMAAMAVAGRIGVPVVDGDGMGRAFPELHMTSYAIYGGACFPAAIADERQNRVVFTSVDSPQWLERIARAATIAMGGHTGVASTPMSGAACKEVVLPDTLSLARRIGAAVEESVRSKSEPARAVLAVAGGVRYLRGKVVDVERRNTRGFARGTLTLEGIGDDRGRTIRIDFQNENLVLWEEGGARATVPDLITLISSDRGEPLTTEVVSYGCRADVLVLPCAPLMRTPRALAVVGPQAFGYDSPPVLIGSDQGVEVPQGDG